MPFPKTQVNPPSHTPPDLPRRFRTQRHSTVQWLIHGFLLVREDALRSQGGRPSGGETNHSPCLITPSPSKMLLTRPSPCLTADVTYEAGDWGVNGGTPATGCRRPVVRRVAPMQRFRRSGASCRTLMPRATPRAAPRSPAPLRCVRHVQCPAEQLPTTS